MGEREGTLRRFWKRAMPEPNTGCWLWFGCSVRRGYGTINVHGKAERAHRFAYEQFVGPIPPGLQVLHRCDVTCCVNPEHLFLGTFADNMRDRNKKGRQARDVRNGGAKLNRREVREIFFATETHPVLARRYGVHVNTVWRIKAGKKWAHYTRTLLEPNPPHPREHVSPRSVDPIRKPTPPEQGP
jgi:hypothetical protein